MYGMGQYLFVDDHLHTQGQIQDLGRGGEAGRFSYLKLTVNFKDFLLMI
jgi:hypothetical protein